VVDFTSENKTHVNEPMPGEMVALNNRYPKIEIHTTRKTDGMSGKVLSTV
jgi:hypothetical protein